ncbi:MAG: hypothetical protein KJZ92_14090 [Rhodocyclaceae bacterium]|nr:hypothetical protein [Rhodocyclaceae bacterium]
MIYFATIQLAEQIHAGCLGFTSMIFEYVEAKDPAAVPRIVETWCRRKGLKFDRVRSISVAHHQSREKYTFPEQIIRRDSTSSHRTV